ncbi:MAG: alpha/beta hydrolase [Rhodospirillaceae bacterium]|nr:alpha/beta hydrolase [Rhodospirillaceae bacterium]MBT5458587.1 alpha/beta hydrolase [Rhodospirillaceae bacterium]
MAFDDLKPQPPRASLNPNRVEEFERYAATALARSAEAAESCRTVPDVAFGEDYYQKLDLYLPDEAALANHQDGVPVILFCHGGGWTFGYKEWNGFMAPALIDLPAIFVSLSYRLAPENKFPAALDDVLAGLSWVYHNIANHGGDSERLFIGGWSAGAALAALATVRRDLYGDYDLPDDVIKACVATSCPYDHRDNNPAPGSTTERLQRQLFTKPEHVAQASAITYVEGLRTPFFISHGENDFPHVIATSLAMRDALTEEGCPVEYHVFSGFDHYDNNLDQGRRGNKWVETVRQWMADRPVSA